MTIVGIVGAGTMGAGIAQVVVEAGDEVVLHDVDETALERARARVREGLTRRALRLDLDPDTTQHFDQHMADCPPCVYYVQTFRKMIEATGRIPTIEPITIPIELKERLHRFLSDKITKGL